MGKKTVTYRWGQFVFLLLVISAIGFAFILLSINHYKNFSFHPNLIGNEWIAYRYKLGGKDFVDLNKNGPRFRVTLYPDGKIDGYDGCNYFSSNYKIVGNIIQLSSITETAVDCENMPLYNKVDFIFKMPFVVNGNHLIFSDEREENVLELSVENLRVETNSGIPNYTPAPTLFFTRPGIQKISTNTWEAVNDDRLGISVKFPPDLIAAHKNENERQYLLIQSNPEDVAEGLIQGSNYISFFVDKNAMPSDIKLSDWIMKNSQYEMGGTQFSFIHSQLQPFTIGKYSGYSAIEGIEIKAFGVYIQKDDVVYHFVLQGLDTGSSFEDNTQALNIFLNMMETVRFY